MHRKDRACHWCGERKPSAWRSGSVLKAASGVAAVALVAVGSWAVRGPASTMLSDAFSTVSSATEALQVAQAPRPAAVPVVPNVAAESPMASTGSETVLTVLSDTAVLSQTAEGSLASADTARWEPAVARTWVNVRSDAGRGGDVVGVIKPSERAMLGGESRAGWRQVKAPDMSGWVDPRLFESDSLRTRG